MRLPRLCQCLVIFLCLSGVALAAKESERTQVRNNITIAPNEEVSDATCFGCSVHVRGHVSGDVTTFGGSIVVEENGQIGGDATAFAGNIRLEKDVQVNGDVTVFGGRLHRDAAAQVGGDVTNFGSGGWIVLLLVVPFLVLGLFVAAIIWLIRRALRPVAVPA